MNCCNKKNEKRKGKGFLSGLLYGLIPHIGCIAFIVFTVLGVTTATAIFKPLLLNPYFFHILVALSIVFATISALFYFKKQGFLTLSRKENGLEISFLPAGIKRKWKYLSILYGTTVGINLLLFMVIFPIAANLNSETSLKAAIIGAFGGGGKLQLSESGSLITLQVKIPCPGHASLIIGELKGINGVERIKFKFPNLFDVGYNSEKTSKEQILSLDVFGTYEATIVNEEKGQIAEFVDNVKQAQPPGSPGNNPAGSTGSNTGSCCAGGSTGGGCGCGCGN